MSAKPRIVTFDGLSAIADALHAPHVHQGYAASRDHQDEQDWDLRAGYDNAERMLLGGWAEGAREVYRLSDNLNVKPQETRKRQRRNVIDGSTLHVGRYLAGLPDCTTRRVRANVTTPGYLTLYIPTGYPWFVHADNAFNRGVAFAAIIDALEQAGTRTRIFAMECARDAKSRTQVYLYKVKDYSERLDVDDFIFQVAHPAMLRRIGFAIKERDADYALDGSYGHPRTPTAEDLGADDASAIFGHLSERGVRQPADHLRDILANLPDSLRAMLGAEGGK